MGDFMSCLWGLIRLTLMARSTENFQTFLSLDGSNPPIFSYLWIMIEGFKQVLITVNYAFNTLDEGTSNVL